jgi:hypothetical protein
MYTSIMNETFYSGVLIIRVSVSRFFTGLLLFSDSSP